MGVESPEILHNGQSAAAVESAEVRHEDARRRRLWPRGAAVGLVVGVLAVAFRWALDEGDALRLSFILWAQHFGVVGILLPMGASGTLAAIGLYMVETFAPEVAGSGIPHARAVVRGWREIRPWRVIPVKFAGGALSLGAGLAMGREGPTVQMGSAGGDLVASALRSKPYERRALVAAGAGAGLAAAFNAPLAGMIFVLEEIQRDLDPATFTTAFVACILADVVSRLCFGPYLVFTVAPETTPTVGSLPFFVALGCAAGVLGVAFNRGLLGSLDFFNRIKSVPVLARGFAVGALVGALGFFHPHLLGGGREIAQEALTGSGRLSHIPALFAARFALTMGSYGSGAAGGIFAPFLALGAQLGLACGLVTQQLAPTLANPADFAVVGMAAYFTAIVRAPLTGIVLIVEMTAGYSLMLPLLCACLAAYAVAEAMGDEPIYEALLERMLRGDHKPEADLGHTQEEARAG